MNAAGQIPEVTVARYGAPRVSVTPVTDVVTSEPIEGRSRPGHYQSIMLNVATAELSFHESTEHLEPWLPQWKAVNDVPRETWKRWHPGTLFSFRGPHMWFQPVPELLSWVIDSGVKELPYLDVPAANALLETLVTYAQALLDGLFVAGGELDWSAGSATAGRNIGRLCQRDPRVGAADEDRDLVDFEVIVRRYPHVYRPELLLLSQAGLAKECEYVTRYLGHNERWNGEIKKTFGKPYSDGSGVGLDVLGVRAWYRTALLDSDPRELRDFSDWDAEHGHLADGELTAATTDDELAVWVEREEGRAARENLRLLGTQEAVRLHRAQLRATAISSGSGDGEIAEDAQLGETEVGETEMDELRG
ncbi:hypothetical protein GCM10027258_79510 [Amycolatopsis stemonae]